MKIVLAILLMGGVVGLQAVHERRGGPPASATGNLLYVRSPEAMNRLALSYDALLADLYWLRAVQHYGSTKLSTDVNKEYDLLYPLLDLTTSLDPRFSVAYHFGSIFLAEPPPAGPGRPEQAITLLRKGLRAQPDKWEYAQAIGFVYYWWLQDYTEAAAWFKTAAAMPDAPVWMTSLAATTLAQGGRRDSSRLLWQQIADTAESGWFRAEAARRLMQLDAMDQIDELQRAVNAFQMRQGRVVSSWNELQQAGYLVGRPADPTGVLYLLESGTVGLDRKSRLFPLPTEPISPPA
jgi:tetratricopeptide (TPR) repeat protein